MTSTSRQRYVSSVSSVLALAAVVCLFRGTSGAQVAMNADDCAALLSWETYAALGKVTMGGCALLPACAAFEGITCSATGRVTAVWLPNANLSGTLPAGWSTLTTMYLLNLGGNNLSGPLPPKWSSMAALKKLLLYSNHLSGTLPVEWSAMPVLFDLQLWNNDLSGTLPKEWGTMAKVQGLYVASNNLSGTLPKEWSTLTALKRLFLDNNTLLSGPLPEEWSAMPLTEFQGGNGTSLCGPDPFVNVETSFPACVPPTSTPAANPTPPPPSSPPPTRSKLPIIIGATAAVVAIIAACVGGLLVLRRHGCTGLRPPELPTVVLKGTDQTRHEATGSRSEGSTSKLLPHVGKRKQLVAEQHTTSTTSGAQAVAPGGSDKAGIAFVPASTSTSPPADAATQAARNSPPGGQSHGVPVPQGVVSTSDARLLPAAGSSARTQHVVAPPSGHMPLYPAPPLALAVGGRGDGSEVVAALTAGAMLPTCIQLASRIVSAGESVVANNARCTDLVQHVAFIDGLLHRLQAAMASGGEEGAADSAAVVLPTLQFISSVFEDVLSTIHTWCQPSRMGAAITVLRNMAVASWYQEEFYRLESRLQTAYMMLLTAMGVQDQVRRYSDKAELEAKVRDRTMEDLRGLIIELVAVDESGKDQLSTLQQPEVQKLRSIFSHQKLDLADIVTKARVEALDRKMEGLLLSAAELTKGELIGKGGCASVFKGTWKGSEVAIKCIELVGTMMLRDQMDIKREAYIHKQAHDHPNICKLRGIILPSTGKAARQQHATDEFALVLELLQGDLGQYLRGAKGDLMSQSERIKLAVDVAEGMAHLHSKNIIHGDLKPGNLLIRESQTLGQVQVVVSDFGLSSISCVTLCTATMAAQQVMQSSSTGLSLWYSPPELLDNCIAKKAKSGDVYAFGIILFEIFTGQYPYIMSHFDWLQKNVLEGRRPMLPDDLQLPPGSQELMSSCWDANPAARPSFDEIKQRLYALLAAALKDEV